MCGIAGIVGGGDEASLVRMADIQSHRGPDDSGHQWFPEASAGLAHRRLSIIDLSPAGHQPMCNQRGTRWITYNGELYNYRELRDELRSRGHSFRSATDTEVILAAYDEWGAECVRRFNGMFAFGIYDSESRELYIARDHLGIKPLYYYNSGDFFAFASESKALFELDEIEKKIDFNAVVSTLLFLWVPEPITGFEDIRKLPPGSYGLFAKGQFFITEYWNIPVVHDGDRMVKSEGEYIEELRELLERAVQRQMISDVPVGAFLSGGLDSSLIVALMRKVNSGKISTYTISFSPEDKMLEAMPDDARYAAIVARHFGTDHHEIPVNPDINKLLPKILWHLDDPIADGAAINTYLIAKGAREAGTTVLLNGMGADEIFGGYRKHLATLLGLKYRRIPATLRRGVIEPLVEALPVEIAGRGIRSVRWAKKFLRSVALSPLDAFIEGFAYFNREELHSILNAPYNAIPFEDLYPIRRYHEVADEVKGLPLIDQMTYLDTKLFLPGINLIYSDKAAMAASVETRPPLLDIDLIEFAARLPGDYKIRGRMQKYLLKKAAEAYLPKEIVYRPKAAFGTPIRAWMKRGLMNEVRREFKGRNGIYLRDEAPLQMLDAHVAGQQDNAHKLWGLYALARWVDINTGESVMQDSAAPVPTEISGTL